MSTKKNLYIISGCNGAGKTTASYTILPEILSCREFINADEIARGISPFQPETVAMQAGRIMVQRMNELLSNHVSFAFETTLSARSYQNKIKIAKQQGYKITLVFFWLNSIELAKQRVKIRVAEGGHHIPDEVVARRYIQGIKNLFEIYLPIVDHAMIFDNSFGNPMLIAEKQASTLIYDQQKFEKLLQIANKTELAKPNQQPDEMTQKIMAGLALSYQRLLTEKKKNNGTIVVEREGKITYLTGKEIS